MLEIETLTDKAEKWVQEHALEFGDLKKYPRSSKGWDLYVFQGYNTDDILHYLRELWDNQAWPEELDCKDWRITGRY